MSPDGNHDEPAGNQDGHNLAGGEDPGSPLRLVRAERLKGAGDAVPKMRTDNQHGDDVEPDDDWAGKAFHFGPVQVVDAGQPRRLVRGSVLESLDVDDDEDQQPDT